MAAVSCSEANVEVLCWIILNSFLFAVCDRNASLHEKLFLRAILAEFTRTGVEEAVFRCVYKQHVSLCRFDGMTKYLFLDWNTGCYLQLFTAKIN